MKLKSRSTWFGGSFLLIWALVLACTSSQTPQKLPILGPREAIEGGDTLYHQIQDFEFINQDSVVISHVDFVGKVYIANFFFTHCPSICPTMQRNLLKVYEQYKGDDRIGFLSHSIDVKNDSPAVLKAYAHQLGVEGTQWQFVTADDKASIYRMADQYMVYAKEDATVAGGYDHSGYFILVDQERHIRGAYDGTSPDQIALMLQELAVLLEE
jgi:protein SCO1/2